MDFDFSEDQEMLRKSVRDFLVQECPKTLVREMEDSERGYSPELWLKMVNLGWLGLIIPEEYGGVGGSFLDLTIVFEEMGRACLPSPFFPTVILGALPIIVGGTDEQKREYLPQIANGKTIFTMALAEPTARFETDVIETKATIRNGDYLVNGTKLFVPDAHVADFLLCVARTREGVIPEDGVSILLMDAKQSAINCTVLKTIASDKQCEVVFKDATTPGSRILGEPNQGWPIVKKTLEFGTVAKCAETVGNMQQVLEMATNYAKERVQFGQPIGSFQAIQHHCANMLIDVDGSWFITYEAAWKLAENLPASKEVSMAKAFVSEASRQVTLLGHGIFGGIGFTKDHDMQLYYRRAKAAALSYGNADYHRELVAHQLLL